MGCTSSKRVKSTVDVYHPPPSSFAVFNINAIDEPWVVVEHSQNQHQEKPARLPPPILDKLNTFESDVPHSWDEISKALDDLKPAINDVSKKSPSKAPAQVISKLQNTRKSSSFHTLEELDAKLCSKPAKTELRKTESMRNELEKAEVDKPMSPEAARRVVAEPVGFKSVKDNIFLVRDRQEREKEGKMVKRDPLSEFPDKCPPGGAESVVVYTTSLRGVRRTHEDCSRVRGIFEVQGVVVDERDVSLHGEYLNELRGMLGEEATVPRVFLKGRYLGGVEELVELDETGRLGRLLRTARVERGVERMVCEGCGGARFVPCMECNGSCKVVVDDGDKRERCGKCNENGLVHCPACF
ncbi:hypothetical protein SLE2022_230760 [Rubroshorea leprosula]